MSPKGPCVKGLVPNLVLLGGGGNFKEWGLVGGGFMSLVMCPEKELWAQSNQTN
jgi:hypothetical protein